jgi:hypothetical protein
VVNQSAFCVDDAHLRRIGACVREAFSGVLLIPFSPFRYADIRSARHAVAARFACNQIPCFVNVSRNTTWHYRDAAKEPCNGVFHERFDSNNQRMQ